MMGDGFIDPVLREAVEAAGYRGDTEVENLQRGHLGSSRRRGHRHHTRRYVTEVLPRRPTAAPMAAAPVTA